MLRKIPKAAFLQIGTNNGFQVYNHQLESDIEIDFNKIPVPSFEDHIEEIHIASPDINVQIEDNSVEANITINDVESKNKLNGLQTKYHIFDLFWLFNEQLNQNNPNLAENEARFVTLSFNIDFGNIRVSFYSIPNGAIHGNTVFLQSMQRMTAGTIYPGSCFKLVNGPKIDRFTCIEQLFSDTGDKWQKERPVVYFEKNEEYIRMNIYDQVLAQTFFFDFSGWQKDALIHACSFAFQKGFNLTGKKLLNKE